MQVARIQGESVRLRLLGLWRLLGEYLADRSALRGMRREEAPSAHAGHDEKPVALVSKQSSRGAAWEKLRRQILERDSYTCSSCGSWLEDNHPDPDHRATVDHIIPKAAGGKDEPSNLVAMCLRENGAKQDRVLARVNWVNPRWLDAA